MSLEPNFAKAGKFPAVVCDFWQRNKEGSLSLLNYSRLIKQIMEGKIKRLGLCPIEPV